MDTQLFATVRAKMPLSSAQRQALLSHWSPRVAKAIACSLYPDFRGTYEQHLWLLTLKAAETAGESKPNGYTTYAWEAKEKGILFLLPVKRIEDTRLCGPSHYLYYILKWQHSQVNTLLYPVRRRAARLNRKYLAEALRTYEIYTALCDEAKPGLKGKKERRHALNTTIKIQIMLGASMVEFQKIAYGWTPYKTESQSRELMEIDTVIQARR